MAASVSVLISTFNRGNFIRSTLDAILNQTVPPRQVIVINDGSTDGTAAVLDEYRDKIERIDQQNAGKSAALNRALPKIREDYVWIFDDDDIPFEDALERHLNELAKVPEAGFTYSPMTEARIDPDGTITPLRVVSVPDLEVEEFFPRLLESCFVVQPGSLVRTGDFLAAGKYREDLKRSLDYEFLLRLARNSTSTRVKDPTFYYRVHDGLRGTANERIKASDKAKVWYRNDQIIFREVYHALSLWEYLPHRPGSTEPELYDKRKALIKRANVMGTKGLWDFALADFQSLADMKFADKSLSKTEKEQIRATFSSVYSVNDFIRNRDWVNGLRKAFRATNSRELTLVIGRKLYHETPNKFHNRNFIDLYRLISAIIRLIGLSGLGSITKEKIGLRPKNQD